MRGTLWGKPVIIKRNGEEQKDIKTIMRIDRAGFIGKEKIPVRLVKSDGCFVIECVNKEDESKLFDALSRDTQISIGTTEGDGE
jgi:hypothetical protein